MTDKKNGPPKGQSKKFQSPPRTVDDIFDTDTVDTDAEQYEVLDYGARAGSNTGKSGGSPVSGKPNYNNNKSASIMDPSKKDPAAGVDAKLAPTGMMAWVGFGCCIMALACLSISFCSPYWLQTWPMSENKFRNIGLWQPARKYTAIHARVQGGKTWKAP